MADIIWDSELGPEWPDDWEHTTVHAQFVAVTGDGADTDRLPDIAPSGNGEVIFTPSLRTVRYVGADGPYVVSLKQYRAVVDSEGYLCTPDTFGQPGERGIVLPSTDAPVIEPRGEDDNAFTWRVDFDIPAVTIRSDHIAVPVDGPYNLVDLLSPERAAGVVHIIDRVSARDAIQAAQEATAARDLVLPARDQTLAARDQTLAHNITVDTSVGTRVFVGDTMIYGDTGWRNVEDILTDHWGLWNNSETPVNFSYFRIRRENSTVFLEARLSAQDSLEGVNRANPVNITDSLPNGFLVRNNAVSVGEVVAYDDGTRSIIRYNSGALESRFGEGQWRGNSSGSAASLTLVSASWSTSDPWPASLPGTPA